MANVDLNAVQLHVVLAGQDLTIPRQNLMSLSIDRNLGDAANTFTLEVFDETAFEMETLLIQSPEKTIKISYTNDTNRNNMAIFTGFCYDYQTTFSGRATMLSITGVVSMGTGGTLETLPATIKWVADDPDTDIDEFVNRFGNSETKGKECVKLEDDIPYYNPSRIFERICLTYGISPTFIDVDESAWIQGLNVEQTDETASSYIVNTLAKNAMILDESSYSKSKAGFKFYIDNMGYHFKVIDFYANPTASFSVGYGTASANIISFSIKTSGALAMATNLSVDASALDEITGDLITSGGENVLGSGYNVQDAEDQGLTISTFYSKFKGNISVDSSSTQSKLNASLANRWNELTDYTIKAELTIWGNSGRDIAPGNYINVVVMGASKSHWSSGTYFVIKSKDSITASGYTQTLTVLKNPANIQSKLFVDPPQKENNGNSGNTPSSGDGSGGGFSNRGTLSGVTNKGYDNGVLPSVSTAANKAFNNRGSGGSGGGGGR